MTEFLKAVTDLHKDLEADVRLCMDCGNYDAGGGVTGMLDMCLRAGMEPTGNVVRGMRQSPCYCTDVRRDETKCGQSAKWFVPK